MLCFNISIHVGMLFQPHSREVLTTFQWCLGYCFNTLLATRSLDEHLHVKIVGSTVLAPVHIPVSAIHRVSIRLRPSKCRNSSENMWLKRTSKPSSNPRQVKHHPLLVSLFLYSRRFVTPANLTPVTIPPGLVSVTCTMPLSNTTCTHRCYGLAAYAQEHNRA